MTLSAGGKLAIITQGPTPFDRLAAVRMDGDVVAELEALSAALGGSAPPPRRWQRPRPERRLDPPEREHDRLEVFLLERAGERVLGRRRDRVALLAQLAQPILRAARRTGLPAAPRSVRPARPSVAAPPRGSGPHRDRAARAAPAPRPPSADPGCQAAPRVGLGAGARPCAAGGAPPTPVRAPRSKGHPRPPRRSRIRSARRAPGGGRPGRGRGPRRPAGSRTGPGSARSGRRPARPRQPPRATPGIALGRERAADVDDRRPPGRHWLRLRFRWSVAFLRTPGSSVRRSGAPSVASTSTWAGSAPGGSSGSPTR